MEWLWGICVFMADDGLGCGLAGLEPEETDVHVPCCLRCHASRSLFWRMRGVTSPGDTRNLGRTSEIESRTCQ